MLERSAIQATATKVDCRQNGTQCYVRNSLKI